MEVLAIIGYLFGLGALIETQRLEEEVETLQVKEKWKREQCPKNIHFRYIDNCSACGIDLRRY